MVSRINTNQHKIMISTQQHKTILETTQTITFQVIDSSPKLNLTRNLPWEDEYDEKGEMNWCWWWWFHGFILSFFPSFLLLIFSFLSLFSSLCFYLCLLIDRMIKEKGKSKGIEGIFMWWKVSVIEKNDKWVVVIIR